MNALRRPVRLSRSRQKVLPILPKYYYERDVEYFLATVFDGCSRVHEARKRVENIPVSASHETD